MGTCLRQLCLSLPGLHGKWGKSSILSILLGNRRLNTDHEGDWRLAAIESLYDDTIHPLLFEARSGKRRPRLGDTSFAEYAVLHKTRITI